MQHIDTADVASYVAIGNAREAGIGSCDTDTQAETRLQYVRRMLAIARHGHSSRRLDALPFVVMSCARHDEREIIRRARIQRIQTAYGTTFRTDYDGRCRSERLMSILYRLDAPLALLDCSGMQAWVSPSVMSDWARNGVKFEVLAMPVLRMVKHLAASLLLSDRAEAWIQHARANCRSVLALVARMMREADGDSRATEVCMELLDDGLPDRIGKADRRRLQTAIGAYLPDLPRKARYRHNNKQESLVW